MNVTPLQPHAAPGVAVSGTLPRDGEPPIVRADGVSIDYANGASVFRAVRNVSFDVFPGECVGLVGESGSGKSTLARAIAALQPVAEGRILVEGRDIADLSPSERLAFRREVQIVFQDSFGALNPRMTVGAALHEVLKVHAERAQVRSRADRDREILRLLDKVGLPSNLLPRYPHELSGGQRQRVSLARALALRPRILIADEPVSALDVSVQAQVIHLLHDLRQSERLTLLFVAHDLAVVRLLCSRAVVLQSGEAVESGGVERLFASPSSEYTRRLLDAVLDL